MPSGISASNAARPWSPTVEGGRDEAQLAADICMGLAAAGMLNTSPAALARLAETTGLSLDELRHAWRAVSAGYAWKPVRGRNPLLAVAPIHHRSRGPKTRWAAVGDRSVQVCLQPGDVCLNQGCPRCGMPFTVGQIVTSERIHHLNCVA